MPESVRFNFSTATMRCGGFMSKSRRQFLTRASGGLLGLAVTCQSDGQQPASLPPGAPPAFGTAPAVGPEVSKVTFAAAQKLAQAAFTARHPSAAPNTS